MKTFAQILKIFFIVMTRVFFYPAYSEADVVPSFGIQSFVINLEYAPGVHSTFDSCAIIFRNDESSWADTIWSREGRYRTEFLTWDSKQISLNKACPSYFKLLLARSSKQIISPWIWNTRVSAEFNFIVMEDNIEDNTPYTAIYFRGLLITLFVEIFVFCCFIYFKWVPLKSILFFIIANLVSHPIVWLGSSYMTGSLFGFELIAILLEAVVIKWIAFEILSFGRALRISFLTNLLSFLAGGFL